MTLKPALLQRILLFLAWLRGLTYKEIAARSRRKERSIINLLTGKRKKPLPEAEVRALLPALQARPAHAAVVAGCFESLEALDRKDDRLTPEERDAVELWLLGDTRERRRAGEEITLRARETPPLDEYPQPQDREPARWLARAQLRILKGLAEDERLAVVRSVRKYQHWALAEAAAHESTRAASKGVALASAWARLAVEVAERVRGPEGWQRSVRGYAAGCEPNAQRVKGNLDEADAGLAEARRLWQAGSDPDRILDPGWLLGFEASLRRDQGRFPEAVACLDEALALGRSRGRVLVKKGATLLAMAEPERALEALSEAESLVERQLDPQLWYKLQANLAVCCCHAARYGEAAEMEERIRPLAIELGDENELLRLTWVRGRVAAGRGRTGEGLDLLAAAQEGFRQRGMWYDVALALLESSELLLREGRAAEVRALTPALREVFKSKKVHGKALAALRLFRDAVEQETATAYLADRILRFLYRARYNQGLQFES